MSTETDHTDSPDDLSRSADNRIDAEHAGPAETALALPDEQLETVVQLQKLSEYTVRPGLMRLPVSTVTTAPNSPNLVIELDHPVDGTIRKYFKKPKMWTRQSELKRLLDAYGYNERNMWSLQTGRVYARYDATDDDWVIVPPPNRARKYARRWKNALTSNIPAPIRAIVVRGMFALYGIRQSALVPDRNHASLYVFSVLSVFLSLVVAMGIGYTSAAAVLIAVCAWTVSMLVGIVAFSPGGDAE